MEDPAHSIRYRLTSDDDIIDAVAEVARRRGGVARTEQVATVLNRSEIRIGRSDGSFVDVPGQWDLQSLAQRLRRLADQGHLERHGPSARRKLGTHDLGDSVAASSSPTAHAA